MIGDVWLALLVLGIMIAGEVWRIDEPGVQRDIPLSTATGTGLAVSTAWPRAFPSVPGSGLLWVLLLVAAATVIAWVIRRRRDDLLESLAWSTGPVLIAGVLTRIPDSSGRTLVSMLMEQQPEPVMVSLGTLFVVSCSVLAPVIWRAITQDPSQRGVGGMPVRSRISRELRQHGMLILAIIATGVTIAFSVSMLGAAAFVIGLFPLTVIIPAMSHHHKIKVAQRQTILALSELTDEAGLTVPGHGSRVADAAVRVAREAGERDGELRQIELAGLLHDIGQVILPRPIPGGATSEVSAADQRRVAAMGAGVLAQTPDLAGAAVMVADAGLPFSRVKDREGVSRGARIIRVVSTYDDLTYGKDEDEVATGLERLVRLAPEDLDPDLVGVLIRYLERRRVISAKEASELLEQLTADVEV